jgi:hypothetical protein
MRLFRFIATPSYAGISCITQAMPLVKLCAALTSSILIVACIVPHPAGAVTAELAKKCQALTTKAFPPRFPGNPAAGSAKGSGRDQIEYFQKCVSNAGKVDDDSAQPESPTEQNK